jgi:flagellar hook-associated protein 3 FlgL
MSITRLGTAHMYDRTISNISKQQAELSSQMEHASAGKRVIRASDDPVAAAQAERARTRLSRIETDQRQLDAQTATIQYGESTLGEINNAVQEFRSLIVNAGNGAFNQTQRDTLVEQLQSLRAQILSYSNRTDSNGLPLFRGLDTEAATPFPNGSQGISGGQPNSNEYTITNSLDGALAFFSGKTGNGVLAVDIGATNTGTAWADVGTIKDPALATAVTTPITITFQDGADGMEYSSDGGATWMAYKSGDAISVAGMNLVITGDPKAGDTFTVKPSETLSIFEALDNAIAAVKNNGNPDGTTDHGALAHGLAKSLAEIDTQLNRVSTVRGVAGDLLNQAERMGSTLLLRNEQMEAQRASAEDIDAVAALSQLKTQETMVSAALQSYASIQKLSLFDYIG